MSNVAVEVQSLLSVSKRTGGIGQEIRAIAQAQQNTQASIAGELQQVESRNRFVRWIIGQPRCPDRFECAASGN